MAGCTPTSVINEPTSGSSKTVVTEPAPDASPVVPTTSTALPPTSTALPPTGEKAERLGCHEYCQTAAASGGEGDDRSDVLLGLKAENPVVAFDDGTIPVRIYCLADQDCEGVIMVTTAHNLDNAGSGRSDLLVEAGNSRLLAVPLPAPAVDLIEHGESLDMQVYANVGPTWDRLSSEDQDRFRSDVNWLEIVVVGS